MRLFTEYLSLWRLSINNRHKLECSVNNRTRSAVDCAADCHLYLEYVMAQSSSVDNGGTPAHLWPDLFASLPWLPQDPASGKGIGKYSVSRKVVCGDHHEMLRALCVLLTALRY